MKSKAEHAVNLLELVRAYWDDEDEVIERVSDYVAALRPEAWIEAREKVLSKGQKITWPSCRTVILFEDKHINAAFDQMEDE